MRTGQSEKEGTEREYIDGWKEGGREGRGGAVLVGVQDVVVGERRCCSEGHVSATRRQQDGGNGLRKAGGKGGGIGGDVGEAYYCRGLLDRGGHGGACVRRPVRYPPSDVMLHEATFPCGEEFGAVGEGMHARRGQERALPVDDGPDESRRTGGASRDFHIHRV